MQALMNLPWYMYLMLGVFVVFFIIQKVLPTLQKGKDIVERGKQMFSHYIPNPQGSNLTNEQLKAISVGAINGEQTSCYVDSLTTGMKAERLAEGLGENWGIENSDSAKETLDWLKDKGHQVVFQNIYPIFKKIPKEDWEHAVSSSISAKDKEQAMSYLTNLSATFEDLKTRDAMTEIDFEKGILAWDMGRMIIVARMAYDSKFISESEAWTYINSAYSQSKSKFANWDELQKSYILGRAMWNGDDMMITGIKNIAKSLLQDEKSPWKRVSLN